MKAVCDTIAPEKYVIAGCGCESTVAIIALCRYAAAVGASPLPVILYNMPGNSGVNIPSSLVKKLASHPNIIGIKDTGGNIVQIMEIIRDTPEDFAVFAGSASFLFPTIAAGGKGGTLALANIFPNECVRLYRLTKEGEMEKAAKLQLGLIEANTTVTRRFGMAVSGLSNMQDF